MTYGMGQGPYITVQFLNRRRRALVPCAAVSEKNKASPMVCKDDVARLGLQPQAHKGVP